MASYPGGTCSIHDGGKGGGGRGQRKRPGIKISTQNIQDSYTSILTYNYSNIKQTLTPKEIRGRSLDPPKKYHGCKFSTQKNMSDLPNIDTASTPHRHRISLKQEIEMTEMLACVLMWLGHRLVAQGICLSFHIGQILGNFIISPTYSTTGRQLGFERDYNYHTAFRPLRHHA